MPGSIWYNDILPTPIVDGSTFCVLNHCAGKRKGDPIHPPKKISPKNGPLAHSVYIVISYF